MNKNYIFLIFLLNLCIIFFSCASLDLDSQRIKIARKEALEPPVIITILSDNFSLEYFEIEQLERNQYLLSPYLIYGKNLNYLKEKTELLNSIECVVSQISIYDLSSSPKNNGYFYYLIGDKFKKSSFYKTGSIYEYNLLENNSIYDAWLLLSNGDKIIMKYDNTKKYELTDISNKINYNNYEIQEIKNIHNKKIEGYSITNRERSEYYIIHNVRNVDNQINIFEFIQYVDKIFIEFHKGNLKSEYYSYLPVGYNFLRLNIPLEKSPVLKKYNTFAGDYPIRQIKTESSLLFYIEEYQ